MTAKRRKTPSKKKPSPSKPARPAPRRSATPRATAKPARRRAAPAHSHSHAHTHAHGEGRDAHGNPTDFEAYLARLDDPGRAKWQKPERVVTALRLKKGGLAAEVGSGTGQFTIRMAKKVGADGRVYAIDVEPRMLDALAERAAAAKAWGIVGILAPDGGGLPPEPVDVVLMVNVFHHVQDRARYLASLATRLAHGGRIAIVDFHDGELPVGPPADHRLSRAEALAAVKAAGLRVVREEEFLPYQYFLLVGP